MSTYELRENLYIALTPAGAYYAVSGEEETPYRVFLNQLLEQRSSVAL